MQKMFHINIFRSHQLHDLAGIPKALKRHDDVYYRQNNSNGNRLVIVSDF